MAKAGTKSVSATIPAEHFEAIEEFRWSVRKNLSQVISQAVAEFIDAHGIPVKAAEVPAEQPELADDKELAEAGAKKK